MSGSSAQASESVPDCPKCGQSMVRRTARRGANAGNEFWGCSEFPRCRGIVQYQPPVEAPADEDASAPVQRARESVEEATAPDAGDKPQGFLTKVARAIDKGHGWYLERDEPDAADAGMTIIGGAACSAMSMTETVVDAGSARRR